MTNYSTADHAEHAAVQKAKRRDRKTKPTMKVSGSRTKSLSKVIVKKSKHKT